jgi:DNA-3-methyladenine glycosylase I
VKKPTKSAVAPKHAPVLDRARCAWPGTDPLMIEYHDREWGAPMHADAEHFEYIVLDSFQAGLS